MAIDDDIPRLAARSELPEALRVLLHDYPRDGWDAHPRFTGLVQFWLERHQMFRQLSEVLNADAEAMLDRQMEARKYAGRLSQYGGMLINQLHGHHQIEDQHYFPVLQGLDGRLTRGFEMLDRDHHAMDGLLDRFATSANGVLGALEDPDRLTDATGAFRDEANSFADMLRRHLSDEEDLIVPVILHHGPAGLV